MSRVAYLEPVGGIAGDMVLAALVGVGADLEPIAEALSDLGVPGISLTASTVQRGAFAAVHVNVEAANSGHHHRHWSDIRRLLTDSRLPERAKARALAVFERIAVAEGEVHGIPVEDVHFHEVGAWDSIADIVGVALALEQLEIDTLVASPPPLSSGSIQCDHGTMPLPAPATLRLMSGWPVRPGPHNLECTTPTGAGILAALATPGAMPTMTVSATGMGAGTRDTADPPNVLRVTIGEAKASEHADAVTVIEAQMDDLTGEHLPPLIEALLDAGALDAYATPVLMKKGRSGLLLTALARTEHVASVSDALLRHGSTFGVRHSSASRQVLDRWHATVDTPWGEVRVKIGALNGEVLHASPEYEDVQAVARAARQPAPTVHAAAVQAWRNNQETDS